MKEFLLSSLFARDELNVIKQQHIGFAIPCAKSLRFIVAVSYCVDKLIHELLERKIFNSQMRRLLSDHMTYSLRQVSFPKADATIKIKRIVRSSGTVSDSLRRSIR